MNASERKINITAVLRGMKPGERVEFPIEKLATVRTTASTIKAITGMEYSVTANRSEQTTEVSCRK